MPIEVNFDTYDFFAKTLPGIAFLLGVLTILPEEIIPIIQSGEPSLASSFLTFVSLLIIISLLGVLIGEGIHTVAVSIEKLFDWIGRRYVNTRSIIYNNYPKLQEFFKKEGQSLSESQIEKKPLGKELLYKWKNNIQDFLISKFKKVKFVLVGHRRVLDIKLRNKIQFEKFLATYANMSFYEEYFAKKCLEEFETDPDNFSEAYPVVASKIDKSAYIRSSKFQSRYGFCRGMWVISFIFVFVYLLILYHPQYLVFIEALQYTPVIAHMSQSGIILITSLVFVNGVVFMIGSMRYKLLLVDYLFAEYYSQEHNKAEDPFDSEQTELVNSTDPGQTNLDEYP